MVFSKDLTRLIHLDKNTSKLSNPELILMTKDFQKIGKLGEYTNWNVSVLGNSVDEISFDVAKFVDGKKNPLWDKITDLKVVEVMKYGRFEISVTYTDNTKTVKSVHGYSLETELAQLYLNDFHVNDDDAMTMEMTEYNKDDFDKDGNFIPTVFYNPDDKNHSLLHRVIADKAPHWDIGYVTPYISLDDDYTIEQSTQFQRTFTADGTSIYDFLTQDVAEQANVVFIFDTIHRLINCYSLSDGLDEDGDLKHIAIGSDTNVYISKENLAQEIVLESNKDEIKNCFRIKGGDDTINAYVRAINVTGSNYIYKFDKFQQEDMPKELIVRLNEYQKEIEIRKPQYQKTVEELFKAYDRKSELESSMMPGNADESVDKWIATTAKEMYETVKQKLIDGKIGVYSLKEYDSVYFAAITNNVEKMANIYSDSRFSLKMMNDKCSYNPDTATWTGNFTLTKVDDESDYYPKTDEQKEQTFSIKIEDDANEGLFIKQKIMRELSSQGILDIDEDIYNYLAEDEEFTDEKKQKVYDYFNQYCLARLKTFRDGYGACIASLQASNIVSTDTQKNLLYDRYHTLYEITSRLYNIREQEVNDQLDIISEIQSKQAEIQFGLDLETFLGVELYNIMCMYRREDTYENSNYVSDSLSDSECLKKAQELVDIATKELNKACVVQRTISATLNNIFAIPEFEPLWDSFQLYNYIRIRTDDELLKLRIIGVEVSGDTTSDISVTFADKIESVDGTTSDTKSILDQAQNMATSYNSTVLQAKQGKNARNIFTDIYNNGLNAANAMIKTDDSESVTISSGGILAKRMDNVGFYGDKQLRITGNLIAMTDNNWETVSMAIGETSFTDPYTGETSNGYGVIAENLVGKMMLTEKLYVESKDGRIRLDGRGITLSSKQAITWDCANIEDTPVDTSVKEYCLVPSDLSKPGSNATWSTTLPVWIANNNIWSRIRYEHVTGEVSYSKEPILEDGLTAQYTNFSTFKTQIENSLSDGTEISKDYVITPKIGGGYAYFTNGNYSVEIDPNHYAGDNTLKGYLFCIRKNQDVIMSVDTNGNGTFNGNGVFKGRGEFSSGSFKGNIDATQLKLYKNNTFYGQFDFGHHTYNNSEYYGLGIMSANEEQPIDGDINHRRISFGIGTTPYENIYFDLRSDKSGWDSKHIFGNKCEFYDNPSVKNGCYLKFFPDDGTKNNWTQLSYSTMNGTGEELIYTPNSLYVQQNLYANNGFKVQLQSSSDIRLKKEIQSLNDVKDLYLGFKPKQYKFKTDTLGDDEQIRYGLIANEVKNNLDRCGLNSSDYQIVETYQTNEHTGQQAYIRDGVGLRINYENLHALHIAFGQQIYKELTDKIDVLQKELQELKEKI
ncbi:tail fiber domain-containing protein [uncultured Eubacterium sp.]|mgnify:CR=1 FL=1|uniref:tail fiber domain-containing protein n=1 Tax=uncultured Eubacterium sp. TaxID=165185 RepID=UPI0025932B5C|nr:tail fiber domain-containing protein [uncultured Eubacterium sp.]